MSHPKTMTGVNSCGGLPNNCSILRQIVTLQARLFERNAMQINLLRDGTR
jgi:hypothetical protein